MMIVANIKIQLSGKKKGLKECGVRSAFLQSFKTIMFIPLSPILLSYVVCQRRNRGGVLRNTQLIALE